MGSYSRDIEFPAFKGQEHEPEFQLADISFGASSKMAAEVGNEFVLGVTSSRLVRPNDLGGRLQDGGWPGTSDAGSPFNLCRSDLTNQLSTLLS